MFSAYLLWIALSWNEPEPLDLWPVDGSVVPAQLDIPMDSRFRYDSPEPTAEAVANRCRMVWVPWNPDNPAYGNYCD